MITPTPYDHPSQLELSRAAAERSTLAQALADRTSRSPRSASVPRSHRLRHALAVRLISTARVIDAH